MNSPGFPVSFDLKVIMETMPDIADNKKILGDILNGIGITNSNWYHKFSAEHNYISFTVSMYCPIGNNMIYCILNSKPKKL